MTTPAPATKLKKKRRDALVSRITITIPLDLSDANSVPTATKAINAIKDTLPAGAEFKAESALARVEA